MINRYKVSNYAQLRVDELENKEIFWCMSYNKLIIIIIFFYHNIPLPSFPLKNHLQVTINEKKKGSSRGHASL